MKKGFLLMVLALWVVFTFAKEKTVRVIWMIPTDVEYEVRTKEAMEDAIIAIQDFYAEQLNGKTFKLNDPVVEVYNCEKESRWYTENNPNPESDNKDSYWWCLSNAIEEAQRNLGFSREDKDHKWIIYISSKGNGGASGIVTVLPMHDIEGLIEVFDDRADKGILRWWGGLAHELGHTFGMPDIYKENSRSVMGDAGFYDFPNNIFSEYERGILFNNPRNVGFWEDVVTKTITNEKYLIRNVSTGKVLELTENDRGREVVYNDANGSENQQWLITRVGDGFYKISPVAKNEHSLLIPGRLAENPLKVKCSNYYNMNTHHWMLFPYKENYIITAPSELKVLSFDEEGAVVVTKGSVNEKCQFILEKL